MNKSKFLIVAVCCLALGITADAKSVALKFNADKKFKIVQFTDIHYISGNPTCQAALDNMREALDAEKPDLVVFTGDIIYGKPADKSMLEAISPAVERNLPFAVVFGNHDDEFGMTRRQLFDLIKDIPNNLTADVPNLTGVTNFVLPVMSAKGSPAFILYFFDSNAYSQIEGVKGYDYIHFDQIEWYRKQSAGYTKENKGVPVPSAAFFHIPLLEYSAAASDERTILIGTRKEKSTPPSLNSGMFVAFKEMKDVASIFVGHDHDNDYVALWQGIMLAYGRYSGCNTVYNNLKPNGARVIEITEGAKGLRTWVRLRGGQVINDIRHPDVFVKEKE